MNKLNRFIETALDLFFVLLKVSVIALLFYELGVLVSFKLKHS